ncbi:CBS domain-containing protein [Geomesophilobacter sediminis]|uniref:CBS domain-containing protein n=1 Tax=Geomesophilobacter sediminis TaxID=2798584 RepID=A0A8J7LYF9_9BACT|nr:CBS domain-containing protein [Geomesophilobacter sediminis]MBJ6724732.1 CBS domain-containing protein [Geomesophilobacter sediminis]
MKISKYMSPKVITAHPADGIRKTFFRMKENRIRHLPVLDDSNRLVGILSDRDLRRPEWVDEDIEVAHVYNLDDDLAVGDLMTTEVKVVYTYDSIRKANRYLIDTRFGALPVLNKEEELVGMLSAIDVMRAFDDFMTEHPPK